MWLLWLMIGLLAGLYAGVAAFDYALKVSGYKTTTRGKRLVVKEVTPQWAMEIAELGLKHLYGEEDED